MRMLRWFYSNPCGVLMVAAFVLSTGAVVQAAVLGPDQWEREKHDPRVVQNLDGFGAGGGAVDSLPDGSAAITADDCFHGRCANCEDCSKLVASTSRCYGCCSDNGCGANQNLGCQDLCDAALSAPLVHSMSDPVAAESFVMLTLDRFETTGVLSEQDVELVEFVRASHPEEHVRRLALALIVEAWHAGATPPGSELRIFDSLEVALVGHDFGVQLTAFSLVSRYQVPVRLDEVLPALVEAIQPGSHFDPHIAAARPWLSDAEVAGLAERRRSAAMDAIADLTAR